MSEDFDPEVFRSWSPEAQKQAADLLREKLDTERRAWFCASPGRHCDGKPHEGYPYKHARADQWPPPGTDWFVWALLGGRGSGKTRSGAEYTRKVSERIPYITIVAPTSDDVRNTCIEGESGLIAACEHAGLSGWEWEPSRRKFTFPNGAIALTFSGEEPDRLRGKQSGFTWLDEPAHMALIEKVWANVLYGLRLGMRAHILVTTTPLPTKWIKDLIADEGTVAVAAPTMLNLDNLAPNFRKRVVDPLIGTRLGRQELLGEVLIDVEGALWQEWFLRQEDYVDLGFDEVAIGIDPAGSANKRSDETGIVVCARKGDLFYVIEDGSGRMSPDQWAVKADSLYDKHQADVLVPERNYGGDMVISTLRLTGRTALRVKPVVAMRGKALRAEPIVGMYEQGRVLHTPITPGGLKDLEQEMLEWIPGVGNSPNRVDALVHALTYLSGRGGKSEMSVPSEAMIRPPAGVVLPTFGPQVAVPSWS